MRMKAVSKVFMLMLFVCVPVCVSSFTLAMDQGDHGDGDESDLGESELGAIASDLLGWRGFYKFSSKPLELVGSRFGEGQLTYVGFNFAFKYLKRLCCGINFYKERDGDQYSTVGRVRLYDAAENLCADDVLSLDPSTDLVYFNGIAVGRVQDNTIELFNAELNTDAGILSVNDCISITETPEQADLAAQRIREHAATIRRNRELLGGGSKSGYQYKLGDS